ncbi:MAG: nucleotide exchange factor GrpE [Pseudohongiellaceae bacterium]|jgi:molecular chaperone GrpE
MANAQPGDINQDQDQTADEILNGPDAEANNANPDVGDAVAVQIQEAVNAALADQRDSVLRAHAEVQNMRRRCEVDVEKAHKFALEKFAAEILIVMDNLERALTAVPDTAIEQVQGLCEGVELTLKNFLEILSKFNIVQHNPQGEPFDPQWHQAITMIVNTKVVPNTVIEVMQKGYSLHGRVIRPAMVVVAKGA